MKVVIDGEQYDYSFNKWTMTEAFELKERTGHGLVAFQDGFFAGEPECCKWVAYVCLQRAGKKPTWDGLEFDLGAMMSLAMDSMMPSTTKAPDASDPSSEPEPDDQGASST